MAGSHGEMLSVGGSLLPAQPPGSEERGLTGCTGGAVATQRSTAVAAVFALLEVSLY